MGFSKQDAYLIAKGCNGADHYEKKVADWKLKISNIPNYNKSITINRGDYKDKLDNEPTFYLP